MADITQPFAIAKIFTVGGQQVLARIEKDYMFEGESEVDTFCIKIETYFTSNKRVFYESNYFSIGHFYDWQETDTWVFVAQKALENVTQKHIENFIFEHRQTIDLNEGEWFL